MPQLPQNLFRQFFDIHWLVIGWKRRSIFRLFDIFVFSSIWEAKSVTIVSQTCMRNSFLVRFGLMTDCKKPAGDQKWFSSLVFITSMQCQMITVFFMKVQNGTIGNAAVVSPDDKVDQCFRLTWSGADTKTSLYAGRKWMFGWNIYPHKCRCCGNEAAIYWVMKRNWTWRPHMFHHSLSSVIKLCPKEKEKICYASTPFLSPAAKCKS